MYHDYLYHQKRKNLPLLIQLTFLVVGALLIIAFAVLYGDKPSETEATLISPLMQNTSKESKKDYAFQLLYGEPKRILLKETAGSEQTIKLVNLATNLSETLVSGKRIGFIGQLDSTIFLFLEDKEGLARFTISKYDIGTKETEEFLAFQAPTTLALHELDHLVSLSPDKTRLTITHQSGIVIYTLNNENEITILDNSSQEDCQKNENCLSYSKPLWISNRELLIYQNTVNNQTPLVVNTSGNINAVLPNNLTDFAVSSKGFPLVGVDGETLFTIEAKKTTEVLKAKETRYASPVWLGNEIVLFANEAGVPTIVRTDKLGKGLVVLKEFSTNTVLSDLITDQGKENIFFVATDKTNSNISITFYKMGIKEDKPESFYSISKNL